MLIIKELSSYEQFKDMKEAWDDLISRSNIDNIFLTYDWMDSYIRNCCNGNRLLILTLFYGEALVGIAPLMIRKCSFVGVSVKSVCFIGTTASDRIDFILGSASKEKCIISIMDYLMGINKDWDFLDFQEILRHSGTVEMIEKWINLRKLKFISDPWDKSFFIELDRGANFFLNKISKKFHRKIRKLNNEVRTNLEFRHYMRNEVKEDLFSDIEIITKHSWKTEKQRSIFLKENIRNFHKEIFLKFAMSGYLDVFLLKIGNMPIAYIYNFLYNNRLYNYSIEFDTRYSHISPGSMLMLWGIEDLVSKGIKEIDFGRGEEKWKTNLTQNFRMQTRVRIFNNSFYGKGLYLLCSGFKCIKENIKRYRIIYRILREVKQRFL